MIRTTLPILGILCAASGVVALASRERHDSVPRNRQRLAGSLHSPLPAPRLARRAAHAPVPGHASLAHIDAARGFNHGSALLAFSVLADSAVEHYRGSFENRAMYAPLLSATCSLLAGLHGGRDHTEASHAARRAVYLAAAATGVAGSVFHLYNVTKRPGGFSWHNLFYGAPLGAPTSLLLSGALGAIAEQLRDQPAVDPQLFGMPAGRALALLVSAGLIGTVGEVALLHFRGAFQHRAMYAPVTIAPVAAALLANAALAPARPRWFARLWLRITAALGFAGSAFHVRGVARSQGGWRNWSQNVPNGPPLPAPPAFTALAAAGLAALRLRETER
ncbi:hypothetical protein LJ655_29165 [Paraburkholderia sp. MMS20-SJTN17]|uniref:Uncharacterized protein n=1 Tax=Paraburkholderia translucens TaxID=2886945 RepID=A0ABS8KM91_9BURK|nr:hypothetical protein [Paraburkholderia sp. MMS20-SJTN17]MCC8405877.1 hypothetical protein [Paraburkholderia sp. MMS20-SJTN17]